MTKISAVWTGAVAYVSLLTGAGLSVAGNVADTYRVRGGSTDALDVILAGAAPLLVLLTIEMFVSPRWDKGRAFQALRWIGCGAIGVLAMAVSWFHLNDLLLSRGQMSVVAAFWPFAIDGMAIMSTGLILSTRMSGLSKDKDIPLVHPAEVIAHVDKITDTDAWTKAKDNVGQALDNYVLDTWTAEDTHWLDGLSARVGQTDSTLPVPVSPAPVSRTRAPSEMDNAIEGLLSHGVPAADIKRDIAEIYGVSTKTVSRRLSSFNA